jgi:hypothetical protein
MTLPLLKIMTKMMITMMTMRRRRRRRIMTHNCDKILSLYNANNNATDFFCHAGHSGNCTSVYVGKSLSEINYRWQLCNAPFPCISWITHLHKWDVQIVCFTVNLLKIF